MKTYTYIEEYLVVISPPPGHTCSLIEINSPVALDTPAQPLNQEIKNTIKIQWRLFSSVSHRERKTSRPWISMLLFQYSFKGSNPWGTLASVAEYSRVLYRKHWVDVVRSFQTSNFFYSSSSWRPRFSWSSCSFLQRFLSAAVASRFKLWSTRSFCYVALSTIMAWHSGLQASRITWWLHSSAHSCRMLSWICLGLVEG